MAPVGGSRKEETWLSCRAKTCCQTAIVVPTGRDVWRIAHALQAPPWAFVRYFPSPTPRPDGFLLERSGPQYRLALAKQEGPRKTSRPSCIFLVRTSDGCRRCGLGALRPQVCQTFPIEISHGVLGVQPRNGCTCRRWSLADVDLGVEMALMETRLADAAEYHDVVASWNARVSEAAEGATFDFLAYCQYLIEIYDQIAAQADRGSAG